MTNSRSRVMATSVDPPTEESLPIEEGGAGEGSSQVDLAIIRNNNASTQASKPARNGHLVGLRDISSRMHHAYPSRGDFGNPRLTGSPPLSRVSAFILKVS